MKILNISNVYSNSLSKYQKNVSFCSNKQEKIQQQLEQDAILIKHEKYAELAKDCANDGDIEFVNDYLRVKTYSDKNTGFSASIYESLDEKEVVISFRCTSNQAGVKSDIQMVEKQIPDQFYDAYFLYQKIKQEYPDFKITLVGHSLGGSLAQLVASTDENVKAITFDGFGTNAIINKFGFEDYDNCTNYTTKDSIVSSVTSHPGQTKTIYAHEIKENKHKIFAPKTKKILHKKHSIDNYTRLSCAKFANETVESIKRFVNEIQLAPCADIALKIIPGLKQILPNVFFSDKPKEETLKA